MQRHGAGGGTGFTLIEVMIVLVVLGILSAVVYPSYERQMRKTRRAEAQLALLDAMQRQEQYRALHHSYVAFSATAGNAGDAGFRWWIGASASASAYELDAYACSGQDIAQCVVVRARPGTARVNPRFRDRECGELTFSSTGEQAASGSSERCWP
jgi:type IV pilus assembly protein PilE